MIPVWFPVILGFTHPVSPLRAGLHGFWGAWLRYNSQYSDKLILMGSALLWCSATALQHLTRTMAIACVLCLVAEYHSNAEPVNITLTEYQASS